MASIPRASDIRILGVTPYLQLETGSWPYLVCHRINREHASLTTLDGSALPSIGALVQVRGRHWLVEAITPRPAAGDFDLVDLACVDDDAQGQLQRVFWQAELDARVLDENAWARLGADGFDDADVFAAYLHTRRWNSVTATDATLFQAPFRAGIRIDAYQLEPLRRALALPRVNLFIADDVGLGKTIEAGLIARELLLRRKITSIVVIAPPSMLPQWHDELEARFGISCVTVDRDYLATVRRERGYQVNPWTTHSFFLFSNRRLIDETQVGLLHAWLGDYRSQSLLILDEAHHAAPSSGSRYAIDSQVTRAVRDLARRFEHRIFLSATPHNGHSNSFSALLEMLDPNRFVRGMDIAKNDLTPVLVRRIKSDIRAIEGGFPERKPEQIDIDGLPEDAPELILGAAFDAYREAREQQLEAEPPARRAQGRLVLVNLQKRLLSSIEAFARTIRVHRDAMRKASEHAADAQVRLAVPADLGLLLAPQDADEDDTDIPDEQTADDRIEVRDNRSDAAMTAATLASSRHSNTPSDKLQILAALDKLVHLADKYRDVDDARIISLLAWIDANQCTGSAQRVPGARWNDRRLIIFTEWEDTRRYIQNRLNAALGASDRASERIAVYSGTTPLPKREALKHAFNTDPAENSIRILIATDSAREGLNLQRHCYDLLHFDLPWNPSRIEQRNGRIDRKLQPSPVVYCRYFFYHQRPEDMVLRALVQKTETIRKDLGVLADVLETRTAKLLDGGGISRRRADDQRRQIEEIGDDATTVAARAELDDAAATERQTKVRQEIDTLRTALERSRRAAGVDSDSLRHALDVGLARGGARKLHQVAEQTGNHPALYEIPIAETTLARDTSWVPALDLLRTRRTGNDIPTWRREAAIRPVAFDEPGEIGDRAVQLHLEHRFVRRVLSRFVAKGMLDDLSRACLAVAPDAVPRVVLLGRLSLYGAGGSRLHEEIVEVAARWIDPRDRGGKALQPYGRTAEEKTLDLLESALVAPKEAVPDVVVARLRESIARDVSDLVPYLIERCQDAERSARTKLAARALSESDSMKALLEDQTKRLVGRREDARQLGLGFDPSEMAQLRANIRHWESRLQNLERLRIDEPRRIAEVYDIKATRIEPVGIAYLWPVSS
jgi:superfamily II DNA or RNA helicase